MGQFQNYNFKKKKPKSNWNWCIILLIMVWVGTLIDLLKKPFPDANTVEILTFYGGLVVALGGAICWYRKQYILNHPFKMRFSDLGPFGSIETHFVKKKIIKVTKGIFPKDPYLKIKLRIERTFETINLRLVERKCSIFGGYKDVPPQIVSIEGISDPLFPEEIPYGKGERRFYSEGDLRGGVDGYYNPPYNCPKDDFLWYQVRLRINPDIAKWEGYISFQHRRGDVNRAYARCKIIINNSDLKD